MIWLQCKQGRNKHFVLAMVRWTNLSPKIGKMCSVILLILLLYVRVCYNVVMYVIGVCELDGMDTQLSEHVLLYHMLVTTDSMDTRYWAYCKGEGC